MEWMGRGPMDRLQNQGRINADGNLISLALLLYACLQYGRFDLHQLPSSVQLAECRVSEPVEYL